MFSLVIIGIALKDGANSCFHGNRVPTKVVRIGTSQQYTEAKGYMLQSNWTVTDETI